jgi:thymidylate kinase
VAGGVTLVDRSKTMLVNIRGTNGSGKSTAVRYLLDKYNGRDHRVEQLGWRKNGTRVVAYELPGNLAILGNYEYYQMGGLDGYKPYARMRDELIPGFGASHRFVVYEGILISSNVGWTGDLAQTYGGLFLFLDTPLEECIRRIYARNKGSAIKEDVVAKMHHRMTTARHSLSARGLRTENLDGKWPGEALEEVLEREGWDPS